MIIPGGIPASLFLAWEPYRSCLMWVLAQIAENINDSLSFSLHRDLSRAEVSVQEVGPKCHQLGSQSEKVKGQILACKPLMETAIKLCASSQLCLTCSKWAVPALVFRGLVISLLCFVWRILANNFTSGFMHWMSPIVYKTKHLMKEIWLLNSWFSCGSVLAIIVATPVEDWGNISYLGAGRSVIFIYSSNSCLCQCNSSCCAHHCEKTGLVQQYHFYHAAEHSGCCVLLIFTSESFVSSWKLPAALRGCKACAVPSAPPKDHIIPYHRLLMEARTACRLCAAPASPERIAGLQDKRCELLTSGAENPSASTPGRRFVAESRVKHFTPLCLCLISGMSTKRMVFASPTGGSLVHGLLEIGPFIWSLCICKVK